jgi:putative protease
MNQIELLAPAKDLQTGIAAINYGADAVYIGASRYGARQSVGNPLSDVEKLATYAHKYWARVYPVVNTLLYDDEIDDAVQLCHQLYKAGADAIIIQDFALLESDLPPIPLFSSTQMHNHTLERVAFLEKVGFRRAILARELSLEQIAEIRAATSIELETFIHGALCVCYSGQCALSYAIGDHRGSARRSGNRGQCAQPCRRTYSLVDRHGHAQAPKGHLLSLKDLNLTDYLRDLIEAGVCSFKIEGRLKDQAYVQNVVAHYRQHLDSILPDLDLQPASSGRVTLDFKPDPEKTFNREYTTYFLTGKRDKITAFDTPKHAGEPVGVITSLGSNSFTLNVPPPLHNGDGLTFFDSEGQLQGTCVNQVEGKVVFPAKIAGLRPGVQIRRNADREFLNGLEKSQPDRRIPLKIRFSEIPDGFQLSAEDEDRNLAVVSLDWEKSPAQNVERARATLKRQLTRLGNSEFVCEELDVDLSQPYFLPVSILNALRRDLVKAMLAERKHNYPRWIAKITPNEIPYPESELTFLGNVLNHKAETFYRRHGVEKIEPAAESGLKMSGRKVMTTKHCLKYELGGCPHQKQPIKFDEPLYLVDEDGLQLRLMFDCRNCLMEIYFERAGR